MTNPLLERQFAIPFDRIRAEHVEPAIDALIAEAQAGIDAVVTLDEPRTYENTMAALDRSSEGLEWAASVVGHLEGVATYPAFREAHDVIQPKLSEFSTSVILNPGLWRALKEYAETDDAQDLSGVYARHLEKTLDDFRRHGAELGDEGKATLFRLNRELTEVTTKFAQNLLDATNQYELVIEDEAKLAGLPHSAVAAARANAEAKGISGWRFTLQEPSYVPFMMYLDDRTLRQELWEAYDKRTGKGAFDNRPLIAKILALRQEKAHLLGYRDFADLVLEDRMAGTGSTARAFVTELREKTEAVFGTENGTLAAYALERDATLGELHPWDVGYWSEKQRKELYDFDQEELRPYYPMDRVIRGVFEIAERLYGVTIHEAEGMPAWDPAVKTFRVTDEDGRHRASFYLDLYPRENKRGGAWMHGILTSVPPEPHLGLVCGNLNPPVGDTPALLRQREVETLFHEFGHLMHHCLSDVPIKSLGGANVAWDFVELPSQIMENWCWERDALNLYARHFETDAVLPAELFEKMQRAKTYRAANAQMRQTGFAAVDLALHCDFAVNPREDVMAYARDILQQHTPAPLPDEHGFLATFGHLFSSPVGYAAAYYSYKWAEVLDADAFTRFKAEGIFSRDVGAAFRATILSRGDSDDPMVLYKSFMGREPSIEPLLERQGLLTPSTERE